MKTIHLKSECCRASVRRFGARRRQCVLCRKTWRTRKKKRGRKRIRVHPNVNQTVIERGESLRHKAKRTKRGRELLRRRHERNMEILRKRLPLPRAPKGKLIAVVDAKATRAEGRRHTVYLILLRNVKGKQAVVMEPLIRKGHEDEKGWREALASLQENDRKRITTLVSDGFRSMKTMARENGWQHQRCHFHLLKMLYSLLGRWRGRVVKNRKLREKMYRMVKDILVEKNKQKADKLATKLKDLSIRPDCPKWFGLRIRGFLREVEDFRTYLNHPKLRLPCTTNAAESVVALLSESIHRTRGWNTRKSLELWITVRVRSLKKICCNGQIINQINVS